MQNPTNLARAVAWAKVENVWANGEASCLECAHRHEAVATRTGQDDPVSVTYCSLLISGGADRHIECKGLFEDTEATRYRPAPIPRRADYTCARDTVIGRMHVRAAYCDGQNERQLQRALLDERTAHRAAGPIQTLARAFWAWC